MTGCNSTTMNSCDFCSAVLSDNKLVSVVCHASYGRIFRRFALSFCKFCHFLTFLEYCGGDV